MRHDDVDGCAVWLSDNSDSPYIMVNSQSIRIYSSTEEARITTEENLQDLKEAIAWFEHIALTEEVVTEVTSTNRRISDRRVRSHIDVRNDERKNSGRRGTDGSET